MSEPETSEVDLPTQHFTEVLAKWYREFYRIDTLPFTPSPDELDRMLADMWKGVPPQLEATIWAFQGILERFDFLYFNDIRDVQEKYFAHQEVMVGKLLAICTLYRIPSQEEKLANNANPFALVVQALQESIGQPADGNRYSLEQVLVASVLWCKVPMPAS